MNNKAEIEWSNVFFAILSILIILLMLSWFFGIEIPTFKQIKINVSPNEKTINSNLTCEEVIYTDLNIMHMEIWGETEENKNFYLETKCREFCSVNPIKEGYSLRYKSHSCKDELLECLCNINYI